MTGSFIPINANGQTEPAQEIIQVRILTLRKAEEINSPQAGREFLVEEIMLGAGAMRKAVKYTNAFLSFGSECRAIIISPGKLRII